MIMLEASPIELLVNPRKNNITNSTNVMVIIFIREGYY